MFNYRDNFCTDKNSKFDYNALIKEIGTGQEWNLYFDLSGVLFVNSGSTVIRSASDGCRSFWERYHGRIELLLLLLFLCVITVRYMLNRKQRRFMPLSTDDGSHSSVTLSGDSYVFSLNPQGSIANSL